MMGFIGKVSATKIGSDTWVLEKDLSYDNSSFTITAKKGFTTDFASIPRIAWTIIGSPAMGRYTSSSVIHDVLYATEALSRKECDDLFLEMLEIDGVGYFKRYMMYWAVRAGGGFVWKKHTKSSVKEACRYIDIKGIT
jgi:hypothetical protein